MAIHTAAFWFVFSPLGNLKVKSKVRTQSMPYANPTMAAVGKSSE